MMATKKKKSKILGDLADALFHLAYNAKRVSDKFGVDDKEQPSDWSEWIELRQSILNSKNILAKTTPANAKLL